MSMLWSWKVSYCHYWLWSPSCCAFLSLEARYVVVNLTVTGCSAYEKTRTCSLVSIAQFSFVAPSWAGHMRRLTRDVNPVSRRRFRAWGFILAFAYTQNIDLMHFYWTLYSPFHLRCFADFTVRVPPVNCALHFETLMLCSFCLVQLS